MTPTPEDIALAEEMDEYMSIDLDLAARLIAAHTAPLRELAEIGRLAVEARRLYGIESGAWFTAECALAKSADAYLAKQEESK